jgi:hypothetical protein
MMDCAPTGTRCRRLKWPTFFASGAHLAHEVLITLTAQDEVV